jgi:BA14K-like protein
MKPLLSIATSLLAASLVTSASAAPLLPQKVNTISAVSGPATMTQVAWRYGYHRGWHHRRHYGWGPAIGGLAAGAIVGTAIAASHAQASANAYCEQKYRSFDPASGTYLGYDGQRHPCP